MPPVQFLIALPFLVLGSLLAARVADRLHARWQAHRARDHFQTGLARLHAHCQSQPTADLYERSAHIQQLLPGSTVAVYRSDAVDGMRLIQLRTKSESIAASAAAGSPAELEDWMRALLAQGIQAGVREVQWPKDSRRRLGHRLLRRGPARRLYCVRIYASPTQQGSLWAVGLLAASDWLPPLHSLAERLQPVFAGTPNRTGGAGLATPLRDSQRPAAEQSARMSRLIHDVRLPLARVFAMLENLQMQWEQPETSAGDRPATAHALARVHRQLRTLESFTYDILNVEQDGRAAIDHAVESVDLAERIDAVLDAHRDITDRKRIELIKDFPGAGIRLRAHPVALDRVLFNLLTNSFQFCSSPGQLHLSLSQRRRHIVLDLEDSGPGLVSQENVFELSRRNIGRSGSGWGIGLASARELTRRLGGRLQPVPPRVGQGARFLLVLPERPAHAG